jgi:RND superfamily putative drug exporter
MSKGYNPRLARLGTASFRHPWVAVLAWLLLILAALPLAKRLPTALERGGDVIRGSQAVEARQLLDTQFDNPFVEPVVVAIRSERLSLAAPPQQGLIRDLAAALRTLPGVRRVSAATDPGADARLVSKDRHATFILVGAKVGPGDDSKLLKSVRAVVGPVLARHSGEGLEIRTTGATAFRDDIIARNSADSAKAEGYVLVPALALLLYVFASPLAAALPVLLGVIDSVTAMAGATLMSHVVALNSYVQTTVSMLGLALGIDYALFVVSRYRQERRLGETPDQAIETAMGTAGWTVASSGLVVLVALGALIPSGVTELASVGVGGALVVSMAVALATTLLPALLKLSGRWLDWPHGLSERILEGRERTNWGRWAAVVTRHRWLSSGLALLVLGGMATQAGRFHVGFPNGHWFPNDLEAAQGASILLDMQRSGLTFPVLLVVQRKDGAAILAPEGIGTLAELSQRLHQDKRVSEVFSPVDLQPGMTLTDYLAFYNVPEVALASQPMIGEMFLSHDRSAAFAQVIIKDDVSFSDTIRFVSELRQHFGPDSPYRLLIGGSAAINLDLNELQTAYAPWALGFVFLATAVILFLSFRSFLIPLKAILLNLLAVGAATGMIVLVFLEGHGATWVGLQGALGSAPIIMPTLVFCLTFGLSMDYEIFMLSRIREERAITGQEEAAIVKGLASTGGLVTAAAGIMVLVFGAFVFVEMALVKMLGFGLAVAIGLDATLIRGILAPAALSIAGKWNWWPGDRS